RCCLRRAADQAVESVAEHEAIRSGWVWTSGDRARDAEPQRAANRPAVDAGSKLSINPFKKIKIGPNFKRKAIRFVASLPQVHANTATVNAVPIPRRYLAIRIPEHRARARTACVSSHRERAARREGRRGPGSFNGREDLTQGEAAQSARDRGSRTRAASIL